MKDNLPGFEWWRAFNGNLTDYWYPVANYTNASFLWITFDDEYFLQSLRVFRAGANLGIRPKTVTIYLDENATSFVETFGSYGVIVNPGWNPRNFFSGSITSVPIKQILIKVTTFSLIEPVNLYEVIFSGFRY